MTDKLRNQGVPADEGPQHLLSQLCWDDEGCFCLRCNSRHVYTLGSGRHRCKRCRYTFSEFAGRWLSQTRLSCDNWIKLVRLFEAERSVPEIAAELGRAYATVFHGMTVLRVCILAHSETSGLLLGGGLETLKRVWAHRDHQALQVLGHVPVFGIREHDGTVSVPVLPDISPDHVLRLPVKKVRRGNLVYTGQVTIYDSLVYSSRNGGPEQQQARFCRSPVYIDRTSRFWRYAAATATSMVGFSIE